MDWKILDALTPIILEGASGCVVDLGIGESTKVLLEHTKQFKRKHYTIDSNGGKCIGIKKYSHPDHIIFHGNSRDFVLEFNEDTALVLLDGSHRASTVMRDAVVFIKNMVPHAIMFIHDTCPMQYAYEKKIAYGKEMNTYKARKLLEKMEEIDVLTWRYGVGVTMVLKKDKNVPFYRW